MLRVILRAATAASRTAPDRSIPAVIASSKLSSSNYSSKNTKSSLVKAKKAKSKANVKSDEASAAAADDGLSDLLDEEARDRRLAEDDKDPSLDIGPNGRALFASTTTISQLSRKDTCTYMKFSTEGLNAVLPEGLPAGMMKEFEESRRSALLVRRSFLDLRDNFRRIVDPPLRSSDGKGPKVLKQIVLDGPVSSGKSIALAMLVHWARDEGWLVFYVPRGRDWTHGGFFYKNPQTGSWDTPVQAANILQDFLKRNESHLKQLTCQISDPIPLGEGAGVGWMKGVDSMAMPNQALVISCMTWDFLKRNESHLKQLTCQISDPIPLGEGAGVGWMKGVDSMAMPEGSTLYDLVQTGMSHTHAAVGVVVRLRKELSLVKDIPVLIAVDQYNSWFTFGEYEEAVTVRSTRPIHAKELATVNAFRSMMHDDMMVGAFSHSTAVGKLRQELPDVPKDARIYFPRYSLEEAATVSHYYLRQRLIRREIFSDENWKKLYYLSNGNGAEMRWLSPLMR